LWLSILCILSRKTVEIGGGKKKLMKELLNKYIFLGKLSTVILLLWMYFKSRYVDVYVWFGFRTVFVLKSKQIN